MSDESSRAKAHVIVKRDAQGNWLCDPHDLVVTEAPTVIVFHLDAAGHQFRPSDPVELRVQSESFPDQATRVDNTKLKLLDLNLRKEDVPYDIYVKNELTGEETQIKIDPMIGNQPN